MILQSLAENVTKPIVIVQSLDLRNSAKSLKRLVVQFIDERQMGVGHHDVGKLLNISEAMRQSARELRSYIIRGADQALFRQRPPEESQLP